MARTSTAKNQANALTLPRTVSDRKRVRPA